MIITYQQLEAAQPCDGWLQWFRENIGEQTQTADFDWNPAAQGWLLADPKLRTGFGWLVREGILPMHSMQGVNLSGVILRWADLSGADLSGADLSGADLSGADLSGAILR